MAKQGEVHLAMSISTVISMQSTMLLKMLPWGGSDRTPQHLWIPPILTVSARTGAREFYADPSTQSMTVENRGQKGGSQFHTQWVTGWPSQSRRRQWWSSRYNPDPLTELPKGLLNFQVKQDTVSRKVQGHERNHQGNDIQTIIDLGQTFEFEI